MRRNPLILSSACVCGLVVGSFTFRVGAADPGPPATQSFNSIDAQAAMSAYDRALAGAKADYDQALAAAKADAVRKLSAALDKASKAGNLDEAIAIRDTIKNLQQNIPTKESDRPAQIDLLHRFDSQRDTVNGTWKLDTHGLVSSAEGMARIRLPYKPPAEYDMTVEFTPLDRGLVILALNHEDKGFHWFMTGHTGYFNLVNGQESGNATTSKLPVELKPGQRYVCVVKVRKNILGVALNGLPVLQYKTDYAEISTHMGWNVGSGVLGVATHLARVEFHAITVTEITGHGELLDEATGAPTSTRKGGTVPQDPSIFDPPATGDSGQR